MHLSPKLIFAFQVIEHISEPISFMKSFHLQRGEVVVFSSPATDSVFYNRNGSDWKSFSPSHHLILYNRKSLFYLFERSGIKLVSYDYCFSGSSVFNTPTAIVKHLNNLFIWIVRVLIKGYKSPPKYHGRNSFLSIGLAY